MISQIKVGIDAIALYTPKLYINFSGEWAENRYNIFKSPTASHLTEKISKGIGLDSMSIPDAHEDSVTMAAMAAKKLIDEQNIDISQIGFLAIGTETTADQSKSISSYVLGLLQGYYKKSMIYCACPQIQFACAGATYALDAALNWFRAKENHLTYALVIATDIAKYELGSSGEFTQGAGAIAMLISANPKLIEFDNKVMSHATVDEHDFFRPNWQNTAVVDGEYSVAVYLDTIEKAYLYYAQKACTEFNIDNNQLEHYINNIIFHVPYPRMAEYGAARIFSYLYKNKKEINSTFYNIEFDLSNKIERKQWEKQLRSTNEFRKIFNQVTEKSLTLSRQIGNIYTGSLYLSLLSLLEKTEENLANKRILFNSYGSGATACVFSAKVCDNYKQFLPKNSTEKELLNIKYGGKRIEITMEQYEKLHNKTDVTKDNNLWQINKIPSSILKPQNEFALIRLGENKLDYGYRYYEYLY